MAIKNRIENLEQVLNPEETTITIIINVEGMPKNWQDEHREHIDRRIQEITDELGHKPKIVVVSPVDSQGVETPEVGGKSD